jgi:hypothetical protein
LVADVSLNLSVPVKTIVRSLTALRLRDSGACLRVRELESVRETLKIAGIDSAGYDARKDDGGPYARRHQVRPLALEDPRGHCRTRVLGFDGSLAHR